MSQLPPGFVLDSAPPDAGLPPGFVLDGDSASDPTAGLENYGPEQVLSEMGTSVRSPISPRFVAGIGMGLSRLGRGLGQAVGLVDQSEIDRAHELEAPLANTTGGAAGNVVGTVAGLAPLALIPGANTLGGAAAIGAGSGALATEGGVRERGGAALGGALGGAGSIVAGRGLSAGLQKLGQRAATVGAERATTNETIRLAREGKYVLPPSEMAQSGPGRFALRSLENIAGKEAMGQSASIANQKAATAGMRADLGLPGTGQIKQSELAALKKPLFGVYAEAEKLSPSSAEAVKLWRQANHDAKRHALHYRVSKSPAADDAAQAARADADTYMEFIESEAAQLGKPELAARLAAARVELGKIGQAEAALNKATGLTSGKQLMKAGARSGEMGRAARVAEAFEDYTKPVKRTAMPGVSKLDAFATALLSSVGGPKNLLLLGLPAATRNALLSRPAQALAAPSANPGASRLAAANALANPRVQAALAAGGVSTNALANQKR